MLNFLLSVTGIIITILLVVGIHELGHFLVAKACGIKVLRFSIGFGKALFSWHDKTGTEYVVAAIPLGGYVKMLDESEEQVSPDQRHLAFNHQPYYKKIAVIAAGPLSNLLFAFLIYWILFMVGFVAIAPIIGKIAPNSLAAKANLQPQQEIIAIDNNSTHNWTAVIIDLLTRAGDKDTLQIDIKYPADQHVESHKIVLANWRLDELKPDPLVSLGITPYVPTIPAMIWPKRMLRLNQYGPIEAFFHAYQDVQAFTKLNLIVLGKMITGKMSLKSLGGPISIFESAGAALNNGVISFFSFLAFLSISIGIINIIPIPGLDGGHLFIHSLETVTGKPLSLKSQLLFFRLGMIFLLLVMAQALVNDILRLA